MRRVLLTAGVVALVGGGGFAAYDELGSPPSHPAGPPDTLHSAPVRLPGRPAVLAGHAAPASSPSAAAVTAALRRVSRARDLGRSLVGELVDLDTGARLWSRQPDEPVPPASNAKLLTAAAALTVLGPDSRLSTTVVRRGHVVWLVGGGDVTLASTLASTAPPFAGNRPSYPRPALLPGLAARAAQALRAAGVHRVTLHYDATAETGRKLAAGWKPTYVTEGDVAPPSALEVDEGRIAPNASSRVTDPAAAAAASFAHDLSADGVRVAKSVTPAAAASGAAPVAAVDSPTVAALVQQMLTVSDNDVAESLARAVARHSGRPGTFADGASAVLAADRKLGLPLAGVRLVDGSGLSPLDRVPPRTLVAVLHLAASGRVPRLAAVLEGLPVAGFSGTLAERFGPGSPSADGAGWVRAKTGTLKGVSSLSGLTLDRSGDLLAFSLVASRTRAADLAEPALDHIAATIAGCGCRR